MFFNGQTDVRRHLPKQTPPIKTPEVATWKEIGLCGEKEGVSIITEHISSNPILKIIAFNAAQQRVVSICAP